MKSSNFTICACESYCGSDKFESAAYFLDRTGGLHLTDLHLALEKNEFEEVF